MVSLSEDKYSFGSGAQIKTDTTPVSRGLPLWVAYVFVLSTLVPIYVAAGSLTLSPYRIVLLLFFFPALIGFFTGMAGRILFVDWLFFGAAVWAVISLIANHGVSIAIEPAGIFVVEMLGSYLLARTTIRSAEAFAKFVKLLFWAGIVILPFAAFESVSGRAILLEIIPNSVEIVHTHYRWGLRRAQVLHSHPILFGVFMAIGFSLYFYILRTYFAKFFGVFVSAAGAFLSLSTGALMSIVFQSVFIAWELLTRPSSVRWKVFGILSAACYVILDMLSNRTPFNLLVDYATFNSGSAYNRILIWRFGTQNVADNPIFGLGMCDWVRPYWMSSSADNFWLLDTMRYGLPYIAMFGSAILLALYRIGQKKLHASLDKACRAGFLTAMGGVILAGGTVHYWHSIFSFVLFFFGAGLWAISGGEKQRSIGEIDGTAGPVKRVRYTRGPLHVRSRRNPPVPYAKMR